jgi:D-alanyl-D-alanine endopeptidase (penicillin-binding protein 7)
MKKTRYTETTGLSSGNKSTAKDLALLINYAKKFDLLSKFSITPLASLDGHGRSKKFVNTNRLVRQTPLDFLIQKTGYIKEAGHCVISQINLNGQAWTIVVLGAKSSKEKFNKTAEIVTRIRHSKA